MEPLGNNAATLDEPMPEMAAPETAPVDPGAAAPVEPVEPIDPVLAAIDSVLDIPGPDAVRRVYQLATSAARAKARIADLSDQLDARGYHGALSANPEARYARELVAARRELDALAQERRRLNLEAVKARETGRPASVYELQSAAATSAMESTALGMLLFLALPSGNVE